MSCGYPVVHFVTQGERRLTVTVTGEGARDRTIWSLLLVIVEHIRDFGRPVVAGVL